MSKTEIMEEIELNKSVIKESKSMMIQLDRQLPFIEDYQENFGGLEGVGVEYLKAIDFHMTRIEQAKAAIAKRKKQMKLIEKLEVLEIEG